MMSLWLALGNYFFWLCKPRVWFSWCMFLGIVATRGITRRTDWLLAVPNELRSFRMRASSSERAWTTASSWVASRRLMMRGEVAPISSSVCCRRPAGPARPPVTGCSVGSAGSSLDFGFIVEDELNLQELCVRPLALRSSLYLWMPTQHISWSCFMRAKGRLKAGMAVGADGANAELFRELPLDWQFL